MNSKQTKQQLLARIKDLENESVKRKRFEKINQTLFKISNAINTASNLSELYHSIHQSLTSILDTTNFFIAIYNPEDDSVRFPYCVDQVDGCLPPIKAGFTKTASLTAEVVRTGKAILMNKNEIVEYRKRCGFPIPTCTPSSIWLGAPLKSKGQIIGVIAVQSYTNEKLYDERDKDVLISVADQIALAISRKKTEEMLVKNQEKYMDLYDNAPDLYASIDAKTAEIIDCNKTLCDTLGYKKNEILGRVIFDIYAPESAEYAKKNVFPLFQKTGAIKNEEFQLQKKDGDRLEISLNASAIRDPNGEPVYSRSIFRDITARKRIEEELKKSEAKHRALVENIPGMVYRAYPDWSSEIVSGSVEICGYTEQELNTKEKNWLSIIHPSDIDKVFKEGSELTRIQANLDQKYRIMTKEGDIRWVEDRKISLFSEKGDFIGIDGVVFDITDNKRVEEERESLINELRNALNEINILGGLLPICSSCKKIRDDKGYWNQIESYIQKHSKAKFTHSLCPECSDKLYGDEEWYIEMKKKKRAE